MKKSELRQIIKEELLKLDEASEVPYEEMPEETKKILKSNKMDKSVDGSWHGIHGNIVHFGSMHGDNVRVDKKQLAMLLKDKNLRWIDVQAIGV